MSTTNNTTTQYSVSDYGSNISVVKKIYVDHDTLIDGKIILDINSDEFLPDSDEFGQDWNSSDYINDFLSYREFDSTEDLEEARKALCGSKLRYKADDSFSQWKSEQN